MKKASNRLIAGVMAAAFACIPALAEEPPVPAFEAVERICDAGKCSLFAALPTLERETAAPMSLELGRRYVPSGDGISLIDVGLGGLAGAIIGDEIGSKADAAAFGLLGAGLTLAGMKGGLSEEEARRRDAAWRRGDDIFYNPAHPLPLNPHWFGHRKK